MGTRFYGPTRHARAVAFGVALTMSSASALAAPTGAAPAPPSPSAAAPASPSPSSSPGPAAGGPTVDVAAQLATAEKSYADLDYDKANLIAAKISSGKGLSHSDLVRSMRLLAITDAALGHEDQAREEFIELMTYAADFQVDPNLGPRVTAPFLEARGYWRAQAEKPGVEVTATVHASGPGTLRVITRDPTHIVKSGTVGFRWGSSNPYTTIPLPPSDGGDGAAFDVAERPPSATRLDYYAQVFDDRGNAILEVGNPASPKSAIVDVGKVVVAPVEGKSIFASPVFWVVTGVVVAGAATTAYLLTRPKSATGATLTGGAECGASVTPSSPASACH